MAWTWQYERSDGSPVPDAPEADAFPTQSEAESWLGETWRELADQGIAAVSLFEGDRKVYGPMSLSA